MKSITTKGLICLEDEYHFLYKIARIEYEEYEDEEYQYSIYPNYSVIDLLSSELFQGIPGLDLSLKQEVYVRKNIIPVFISERSPQNNREDLWHLLEENNMTVNNMLEWLIKTDTRYSGDRLFVINDEEYKTYTIHSMYELVTRSNNMVKKLLEIITRGDNLICQETTINNESRKALYKLLMPMYIRTMENQKKCQKEGIKRAQDNHKYQGREKKKIDNLLLDSLKNDYRHHWITAEQAAQRLDISRSTFLRRIK